MPIRLDTSVQFLKGVGPRRAEVFARLGIHTVEDLLYHVPHRYLDATTVTPIARADVGNDVTLIGRVVSTGVLPTRRRLRNHRTTLRGPVELGHDQTRDRHGGRKQLALLYGVLPHGTIQYEKTFVRRTLTPSPDDAHDFLKLRHEI